MTSRQFVSIPMIAMQTICAALLVAACGGSSSPAPAPLASTALPSGAALKPFSATDPSLSKPEGMALTADGRAWVVLANLDANYAPAGPAILAGVTPSTGATVNVDLGAGGNDGGVDDEHHCLNAGQVKNDGSMLVAACTGGFSTDTRGRGIVRVDPANGTLVSTAVAPAGFQPSALAAGSSKIWVGDTNTASLVSYDHTTFALVDGASTSQPAITLPCTDAADDYLFVSDVLIDGSDMFALCSGDPDGYIVQLDSITGAVKGTPQLVGATPVAMALLGDGRIAIVNSIDETLALATRSATGPTVQKAVYTFEMGAALQDVKARGLFVYTVSSGTNTVQKLDLSQTVASKMLVGEVNTGDNTYPWNILPLDDNQAVVSNNGTGVLVGVNFATESADAGVDAGTH